MRVYKDKEITIESFPVGVLGCNASLIYNHKSLEAVIVDPGDQLNDILDPIHDRGLKVKMIIHTHAHFDHIACSQDLKRHTGGQTALHLHDKKLYLSLSYQGQLFGFNLPDPEEADIYFQDGDSFKIDHDDFGSYVKLDSLNNSPTGIKVIHTPGHSPGSAVFFLDFFSPKILLSGDTLFKDSIGRTDLLGGDYPSIISSIKNKLLPLPEDTIVIPGHGDITTIGHEKKHNPFLK